MTIDQSEYVDAVAEKFGLSKCAPVSTPADPSVRLSKSMGPANAQENAEMTRVPYSAAVGCVLYTRLTRIDAMTAIAEVARFMANPGAKHWIAVKRIIKYLRGTRTWGLCYFSSYLGGAKWTLTLYVDSGYGMDPDKRRSRYGYVVFLNGNPVSFGTGLLGSTNCDVNTRSGIRCNGPRLKGTVLNISDSPDDRRQHRFAHAHNGGQPGLHNDSGQPSQSAQDATHGHKVPFYPRLHQ